MKEQLLKVHKRNQLVDMIYVAKNGEITRRRIKILRVHDDRFTGYCFNKQSSRTFIINNVLALIPLNRRVRAVI